MWTVIKYNGIASNFVLSSYPTASKLHYLLWGCNEAEVR